MASLRDTVREYQDDLGTVKYMRKFIYNSGRTQSAQGRETCP